MKKTAGVCVILFLLSAVLSASTVSVMNLWPDGEIPGDKELKAPESMDQNSRVSNIRTPTLTVYLPDNENGPIPAVVICPGGGYSILSFEKEGHEVARWLNSIGMAGIILKNRVKPFQHPIPMLDGQRAVRTVRHNAEQWGIDPHKVGILGFSAGGHLASTVGTHYDSGDSEAADPVQRESCRPDFMILIYPVISMQEGITHSGSKLNLLGENPPQNLVDLMSNELQVTTDTPPVFLVHSDDDKSVSSKNSIDFYLALKKAHVPAEMHVYLKGGHGYGMRKEGCFAAQDWPGRCRGWLQTSGILP